MSDTNPDPADLLPPPAAAVLAEPPASASPVSVDPPPADPPKPARSRKPVFARVLQACAYGAINAVAEVPADEIKAAKADGLVDDNPDAVAYAKSLAAGEAA